RALCARPRRAPDGLDGAHEAPLLSSRPALVPRWHRRRRENQRGGATDGGFPHRRPALREAGQAGRVSVATSPLLIYGANGYTGRLIVQRALEQGLRPILSGRDAQAVQL